MTAAPYCSTRSLIIGQRPLEPLGEGSKNCTKCGRNFFRESIVFDESLCIVQIGYVSLLLQNPSLEFDLYDEIYCIRNFFFRN